MYLCIQYIYLKYDLLFWLITISKVMSGNAVVRKRVFFLYAICFSRYFLHVAMQMCRHCDAQCS